MKFDEPENEEMLFEMANLNINRTGIRGTIYISSKAGHRGPRIKYYLGRPGNNPSASISISDNPEIRASSIRIDPKTFKQIQKFIRLNQRDLLIFWNDHNSIPDTIKFLSGFRKV